MAKDLILKLHRNSKRLNPPRLKLKMDDLISSAMSEKGQKATSTDNGGRRSGGDRRKYSYTLYIPERRNGQDRRDGKDRRMSPRYKIPSD